MMGYFIKMMSFIIQYLKMLSSSYISIVCHIMYYFFLTFTFTFTFLSYLILLFPLSSAIVYFMLSYLLIDQGNIYWSFNYLIT